MRPPGTHEHQSADPRHPDHFPMGMTKAARAALIEEYQRNPLKLADHGAHYFHAVLRDKEIVTAVMEVMGWMLQHAGAFRSDPEVVMTAVRQNWHAMQFAAPRLLRDRGFLIELARETPKILIYSPIGMPHQLAQIFDAANVDPEKREEIIRARATRAKATSSLESGRGGY